MDHAELKTHLPRELAEQVDGLWQRFGDETGTQDADRFLSWMHEQGHLSQEQFQYLLAEQEIEITRFDETDLFLRTIGLSIKHRQPASEPSVDPQAEQTLVARPSQAEPSQHGAGPVPRIRATTPLSHYEMIGTLGQGAMGLVHLAKDRDLQRKVAYKQLLAKDNRNALARFLREAQITAQLDHPHIVPIYNMEVQSDGILAYSMKLVQGKTFKELITETRAFYDRGELPDAEHSLPQLLDYFLKACDAVGYAHSKGVIHRDLKPANIMVGRYQEVYVLDWGIARVMHSEELPVDWVEFETPVDDDDADDRTQAGEILGTPRYMSPQQAAGKNDELDGRSDEFALGLILYELLTLQPAFKANSSLELVKKVLKAEKQPWQAYHASRKLAPELQAIVDKATGQKVHQRYPAVTELAADIRRYLRGEAPLARPDNAWRKLARWVGLHKELSLLVLVSIIVCAGAAVIWSLVQQQQAMIQARLRESRLLAFYTHTAEQGQHFDSYFQSIQALAHGLASTSAQTLSHPLPPAMLAHEQLHINNAFAQPPAKIFDAPDLVASTYYDGEISPNWPIYVISPGVDHTAIAPKLRQLALLRQPLKQVLMDSFTGGKRIVPEAEWVRQLANQGVPVRWSYVCLKEGVLYYYPGYEEVKKTYDVRIRPYYVQSRGKRGIVWGKPYEDPDVGMMIAVTQGLFNSAGEFLGTIGLDIGLSYLREHYLQLTPSETTPTLERALLDENGQVVLTSKPMPKDTRADEGANLKESAHLDAYHSPGVVRAIRRHQPGGTVIEPVIDQKGVQHIFVYIRLNTLGWYYVVEADEGKVLREADS